MRRSSELKFNHIKFEVCGTNGSVETEGHNGKFFRSTLSQNIAYAVKSESEYLEKYGFLIKKGEKYLSNILIEESSTQKNVLHYEMYEKASKIFAAIFLTRYQTLRFSTTKIRRLQQDKRRCKRFARV